MSGLYLYRTGIFLPIINAKYRNIHFKENECV